MSLPFRTLDDSRFGSARSDPYVDAAFGAESGSYSLKSQPLSFKEYQTEPDPREKPKRKRKVKGAQTQTVSTTSEASSTANSVVTAPVISQPEKQNQPEKQSCDSLSWATLPSCTFTQTAGFLSDSVHYWTKRDDAKEFTNYWSVMTYNGRLKYVLITVILIYSLYRIFRSC